MSAGWLTILLKAVPGFYPGKRPDAPQAHRGGRTASAARLRTAVCAGLAGRGALRTAPGSALFASALLLLLLAGPALCATSGEKIFNRATLSTLQFPPVTASVTVSYLARTRSTVEFLKYAPGVTGASSVPVGRGR